MLHSGEPGPYGNASSYAAGCGFAFPLIRGLRLESDLKVGTYLPLIYHVDD
jgi:hypothetical protein